MTPHNILNSFRLKLILAFIAVILVVLTSVYFVVTHFTTREFRDYVIRGNSMQARGIQDLLVHYYEENGSWQGIQTVLENTPTNDYWGGGRNQGFGGTNFPGGFRNLVLVASDRKVVASLDGELVGEKVPQEILHQGIALSDDGKPIGTILAGPILSSEFNQPEKQFIDSINRSMLFGGIAGLLIALVAGSLLFRQLTAPLDRLTEATKKISSGNLDHRVEIKSDDEIGKLGDAFNRMTENLKKSEEIRRRMISDIAHELRTPLTVLGGEVEAIREGIYEPTDEKLEEIQEDIVLLQRLVEDLRELSLAEAGELKLRKKKTDLKNLMERATGNLKKLFEEKNIELIIELPQDLPRLNVDPDRISQVLTNILKNSLRHTPEGGEIKIEARPGSEEVIVSLSDNGEGIEKEKLDHIFERFYQADTSRSSEGGSGLGLSIAKELVHAHGGEIWASSKPGKGTTIEFTLPKKLTAEG